jgi:hypothetical protein
MTGSLALALPIWNPPIKIIPSPTHLGMPDKDTLHLAVGRALNEWEILESVLALIFSHLVESISLAATRAYGTLIAGNARKEALEAAAIEFFREKPDPVMADYYILFNTYSKTSQYRNNIAHGVCYNIIVTGDTAFQSGWFLYPHQYNARRRRSIATIDADYIYKASDIDHCRLRFSQLQQEATDLEAHLRTNYPLR